MMPGNDEPAAENDQDAVAPAPTIVSPTDEPVVGAIRVTPQTLRTYCRPTVIEQLLLDDVLDAARRQGAGRLRFHLLAEPSHGPMK
jgi:hypothetical protein